METWIISLTIISACALIAICVIGMENCESSIGKVSLCIFVTLIIFWIVMYSKNIIDTSVKPIDVYRNKTELKITSINGEPIDTIVVYKYKFNETQSRR